MIKEKGREVRMAKALKLMRYTGAIHRTIMSHRPYINDPLTPPKKGMGHHRIPSVFGSKSYSHADVLTSAYDLLKQKADMKHQDICFITVTFNQRFNATLRTLDRRKSKNTMIKEIWLRLRKYKYLEHAIVVLEECRDSKATVTVNGAIFPKLHLHLITSLNDNGIKSARDGFFKNFASQVSVQTHWVDKRPYDWNHEWDEEEFGETIPLDSFDHDSEYWMNTCIRYELDRNSGEQIKMVHRRLPCCLRGADYISKNLHKPIGRGKNYTFWKLDGLKSHREMLSNEGRKIVAEKR